MQPYTVAPDSRAMPLVFTPLRWSNVANRTTTSYGDADHRIGGRVGKRSMAERPLRWILKGAGFVAIGTIYYNLNLLLKPLDYRFSGRCIQVTR